MKTNALLIVMALLTGIGAGYWVGALSNEYFDNDYHAIASNNNVLLKKMLKRIDQLETDEVTPHAVGDCRNYSGLLSNIRKTINESIKTPSADSATGVTATRQPTAPSDEQVQVFNAVKNRIYSPQALLIFYFESSPKNFTISTATSKCKFMSTTLTVSNTNSSITTSCWHWWKKAGYKRSSRLK